MSDDPVTLLNLREEPGSTGRRGRWWVAALVFPVVLAGLGILAAFTVHNDLGAAIWLAVGGVIGAALLCVGLATVSVTKKEAGLIWAIIAAVPCVALLVWALALLVQAKSDEWERGKASRQREAYFQQIQADPSIGLREHWADSNFSVQGQVFRASLADPRVHYSVEELGRIYDAVPGLRREVLQNPACTPEFLAAHFPAASAEALQYSYPLLDAIIRNPQTPLSLLETITLAKQLPAQAVREARSTLERRSPRPAPPPKASPAQPTLLVLAPPRYDFDQDSTPSGVRFARFQRYESALVGKYVGLKLHTLPFRSLPDGRQVPAPRETFVSVPGMFRIMEKEDYRDVYFLPEVFSYEGDEAMKLASLVTAFAIEHNEKLAKQKGDQWLDGSPAPAPKPAVRAVQAPAKPVTSPPPRAPQPVYKPYRMPASEQLAQWLKYAAPGAEGKYLYLSTLSPRYRNLPDGRKEQYPSRSVIRIIPGTTLSADKVDPRSLYPLGGDLNDDTPEDVELLELARQYASEHNQKVLRQAGKN